MTVRVSINKAGFRISWKGNELPFKEGERTQILYSGGMPLVAQEPGSLITRQPLVILLGAPTDTSIGLSAVFKEHDGDPPTYGLARNNRMGELFPPLFGSVTVVPERHVEGCLVRLVVNEFPHHVPRPPSTNVRFEQGRKKSKSTHVVHMHHSVPLENRPSFQAMRESLTTALSVINDVKQELGPNVEFRVKEDGTIGATLLLEL